MLINAQTTHQSFTPMPGCTAQLREVKCNTPQAKSVELQFVAKSQPTLLISGAPKNRKQISRYHVFTWSAIVVRKPNPPDSYASECFAVQVSHAHKTPNGQHSLPTLELH